MALRHGLRQRPETAGAIGPPLLRDERKAVAFRAWCVFADVGPQLTCQTYYHLVLPDPPGCFARHMPRLLWVLLSCRMRVLPNLQLRSWSEGWRMR